jgi:hypothetical protein
VSTTESQHEGSNPSLTAMVHIKNNFIDETENNFLFSFLNEKTNKSFSTEENFYEWYEISKDDDIFNSPLFLRIFNRNLFFVRNSYGTNLKLHYCGFANQTRGFDYHADSVWPEIPENRVMGLPSKENNTYSNYQGNWIPNYVPNRKYTTVLYLNEGFDGGETHFPVLDILVKPEKNKILGFGCDEKFVHGVMPTTNGVRKAFICWFE